VLEYRSNGIERLALRDRELVEQQGNRTVNSSPKDQSLSGATFRARISKTYDPGLKPWAIFFCPFGARQRDCSGGTLSTPLLHYSTTPLLHYSITPLLHYSITPLLHYSITPLLHYSITPLLHASAPRF
jgi:hypothetical protein